MQIREISPLEAAQILRDKGAKLIDIRECSEFEEERIPGACLIPMKALAEEEFQEAREKVAIFYCRSGRRTSLASSIIARTGFKEVYILKGGLIAWKKQGLPVLKKQDKVPYLMRQIFVLLGIVLLLSSFLALGFNSYFLFVPIFIGAGLLFAGLSGTCLLALLIAKLPWNKKPHKYKIA